MAAVAPSEKTYFEVSAWEHAKRRIPWLLVLMFSSIITGSIITRYENAFAGNPASGILHPDADGHRRKLWFSEFHPDHPRNRP